MPFPLASFVYIACSQDPRKGPHSTGAQGEICPHRARCEYAPFFLLLVLLLLVVVVVVVVVVVACVCVDSPARLVFSVPKPLCVTD